MKILHLYPKDNSQLAQYVMMLTSSLPQGVQSSCTDDVNTFQKFYSQDTPDIIHLHGEVIFTPPPSSRLVITPHGYPVGHHSYVLIARSSMEHKRLAASHKRIETVRNPIITHTTTPQQLASQTFAIYQKVMDSNVLELMDEPTRKCLSIVLKAAICGDARWVMNGDSSRAVDTKGVKGNDANSAVDWRKLFIYAEHEGITTLVQQGIGILRLTPPAINAKDIPTFLPDNYQQPSPMPSKPLLKLIETAHSEKEKGVVLILRMAEIHRALLRPDVDEAMLLSELESRKLLPFFASLLQLLSEQTLLDEGFMPCQPMDNSLTKQLRTLLNNHLRI